jgi:hypothetical protein
MRKLFILFAFCCCISMSAQMPPPGCNPMYALDDNNDGFAEFNLDVIYAHIKEFALTEVGYDLSGYTLQMYPSMEDLGISNPIPLLYTNVVANYQYCYLSFTYNGAGPQYDESDLLYHFLCWPLATVPSLADDDNDSIANTFEDVNGNKMLIDDNSDSDGYFNFMDADDDNDGIPTANEAGDVNGNNIPDYLESSLNMASVLSANFAVYPNPSHGTVDINFENFTEKSTLIIFDISGKELKTFSNLSQTVNVSGFESGVYFLKLASDGNKIVKKLIIL